MKVIFLDDEHGDGGLTNEHVALAIELLNGEQANERV